jgi:hypothetical protein
MPLYGGSALPANNRVVVLSTAQAQVLYPQRCPNDRTPLLGHGAPQRAEIQGVVVEST